MGLMKPGLSVGPTLLTEGELKRIVAPDTYESLSKIKFDHCAVAISTDELYDPKGERFVVFPNPMESTDETLINLTSLFGLSTVESGCDLFGMGLPFDKLAIRASHLVEYGIQLDRRVTSGVLSNDSIRADLLAVLGTLFQGFKGALQKYLGDETHVVYNMVIVRYVHYYETLQSRLAVGGFRDDGTPVFCEIVYTHQLKP